MFLIVQILVFMWRQWAYFRLVMSIVPSPFVSLILISSQFYFWSVKTCIPGKNNRGGGRWFGTTKIGGLSYAQMLFCSLLFLCEHLFTFKFSALMPKISKENFAEFLWENIHLGFGYALLLNPVGTAQQCGTISESRCYHVVFTSLLTNFYPTSRRKLHFFCYILCVSLVRGSVCSELHYCIMKQANLCKVYITDNECTSVHS